MRERVTIKRLNRRKEREKKTKFIVKERNIYRLGSNSDIKRTETSTMNIKKRKTRKVARQAEAGVAIRHIPGLPQVSKATRVTSPDIRTLVFFSTWLLCYPRAGTSAAGPRVTCALIFVP